MLVCCDHTTEPGTACWKCYCSVVNERDRYREALEFYSVRGNQRENDQGGIARAALNFKL